MDKLGYLLIESFERFDSPTNWAFKEQRNWCKLDLEIFLL